MNRKKGAITIFVILTIVFTFFGSTLAYFNWQTAEEQKTNIVFTLEQDFWCAADGGGDITQTDAFIAPTTCTNSTYAIQREVIVTPTIARKDLAIYMDLWIDVNSIDSGLSNSENFRYALTSTPDSCTEGLISAGNFNGNQVGDQVLLFEKKEYSSSTPETYYLYIWLDSVETSASTMDQSFSFSLGGNCADDIITQTYISFDETDSSLRIYKDTGTEKVNNTSNKSYVSPLSNKIDNNIQTIEDVIITEEDKIYFNLENITYTSPEQLPWYEYRESIKKIIIENEISPKSTAFWFEGLTNVEYIDVSKLDTSKTVNMKNMFRYAGQNASTFQIVGLDNLDTSKVANMEKLFDQAGKNATTWSIGDLSNWNTLNVTSMRAMFQGAGYSAAIWNIGNLSNWNIKSTTDMSYAFWEAGYSATTFDIGNLSNWNTSNVINMYVMFYKSGYNATTWYIGDLSNWDVSNVTNMSFMFSHVGRNATTWDIGDLSGWNVSKVTNMSGMFQVAGYNATTFNIGSLSKWNVSNVTDMSFMFNYAGSNATAWYIGDISYWDVSKVTNLAWTFANIGRNATNVNIGNLSNWDTANVTNMERLFNGAGLNSTTIYVGDLSNWNTSKVTNMFAMFQQMGQGADSLDIGNLNTKVVSKSDGSTYVAWDVANVTNMSFMLYGICGSAKTTCNIGNVSNWNTSNVTNMSYMFEWAGSYLLDAAKIEMGDLSKKTVSLSNGTTYTAWDTSNVTTMEYMIGNARLKSDYSLDLSNWNVDKVTNYDGFVVAAADRVTQPTWVN